MSLKQSAATWSGVTGVAAHAHARAHSALTATSGDVVRREHSVTASQKVRVRCVALLARLHAFDSLATAGLAAFWSERVWADATYVAGLRRHGYAYAASFGQQLPSKCGDVQVPSKCAATWDATGACARGEAFAVSRCGRDCMRTSPTRAFDLGSRCRPGRRLHSAC